MKVILHIGLEKTASTFLQEKVFKIVSNDNDFMFYYPANAKELGYIRSVFWSIGNESHRTHKRFFVNYLKENYGFEEKKNNIETDKIIHKSDASDKILLISWEDISQTWWKLNYDEHFSVVKDIFKDCEIIVFLRYQPDWIVSWFKERIKMGRNYKSLSEYLSFKNGEFINNETSFSSLNIDQINYYALLKNYIEYYGRDKVHIYFFEDFVENPEIVVRQLLRTLNVKKRYNIDLSKKKNRGLSAFSIYLTLFVNRYANLSRKEDVNKRYEISYKEAKKNLEFQVKFLYYHVAKIFSLYSLWSKFCSNILDKIFYFNFDILSREGMKKQLNEKFREENKMLLEFVDRGHIPPKYLNKDCKH